MIDPSVSLAMSVQTNPGAYAVLFGSGISRTSGIPTGWGIVCDLVTRVAKMQGEDVGDDPAGWHQRRYGKEPDYSELLAEVAHTPTERSQLLRSYFEPTDEERARGLKQPTPAHRAMARLAKKGFVRMFVTTNFDRLMEQALDEENIVPTVIATPDDLKGAPPLSSDRVTIVKVHGDYVDCRIRNTPAELAEYDPAIDGLLDRIIADHGFIMAGWSAMWDKALVDAFLRAGAPQYGTWWANRRPPKGPGAKLLAARRGEFLQLSGADEFFTELAERVIDAGDRAAADETSAVFRDALPAPLSSFVGREDDIAEINGLLDANRLVTVHALGGSGKTRTAIEVAKSRRSRYGDGVAFVDLCAVQDPERVPEAISYGLGYGPEKLCAAMRGRELLVVLDNCEHVVSEVARFLSDLMPAAPRVSVLATSRVPLGVSGEAVSPLEPMEIPARDNLSAAEAGEVESVKLFVERAREVNPRWRLTDDEVPEVVRICRALDGHPLALELAAARVKVMPPTKIADRLEEGFRLLRAGSHDPRPDRQKTLSAAWAWSLEELDEPARLLFERLAVFRAGFSLEAVEAVCADGELVLEEDVLDHLTELIDQGLVIYSGDGRYRLLEPVRQFATRALEQREDAASTIQRHTEFFMKLVDSTALKINTDQAFIVLSQASVDLDNMRQAAARVDAFAEPIEALMFYIPFGLFLGAHSLEQEGDEHLSRALEAAAGAPAELRASALLVLAYLRVGEEKRKLAAEAVRAAREAWDALADAGRRAECCWLQSARAFIDNDLVEAERLAREGLEIGGDECYHAPLLYAWVSWALRQQDRFEEAGAAAARALELAGTDDPYRSTWALAAYAALQEDLGHWEVVERCFRQMLEYLDKHQVPGVIGRAGVTEHNALIAAILGRTDEALALARITNGIFATRDNRGLRLFFPMLHRGDPKPGDTERSLQRHHQRLKLPPLEAAADTLVERLDEFATRLRRLGLDDKARDVARALADVRAAGGI